MRATRVVLIGVLLVAGALHPARAENWVWVNAKHGISFDADSVYVDGITGFVSYNSATDTDGDGRYDYVAVALDCNEWRYFLLGDVGPGSTQKVIPGWLLDPTRVRPLRTGTVVELTAERLCPQRARFRTGTIE